MPIQKSYKRYKQHRVHTGSNIFWRSLLTKSKNHFFYLLSETALTSLTTSKIFDNRSLHFSQFNITCQLYLSRINLNMWSSCCPMWLRENKYCMFYLRAVQVCVVGAWGISGTKTEDIPQLYGGDKVSLVFCVDTTVPSDLLKLRSRWLIRPSVCSYHMYVYRWVMKKSMSHSAHHTRPQRPVLDILTGKTLIIPHPACGGGRTSQTATANTW